MMLLAVLSISAIFARNFVVFGQLASSTDIEFAQIVKNGTSKISSEFSKILFDELEPNKNFLFSPLNIYVGLALMHLGATNTTKNELSDVLGFPTEESKLSVAHQYLRQLLNDLRSSATNLTTVNIANGVFIQKGINLNEKYVEGVTNYYNDVFQQVDFVKDGPGVKYFIDRWVHNNTEDLTPNILQHDLPTDTIILSASVSEFSAMFPFQFSSPTSTPLCKRSFYTGTKSLSVLTIRFNSTLHYFNNTNLKFEAISFPFWNGEEQPEEHWSRTGKGGFAMMFILPQKGESLRTLISSLKPEQLSETINSLEMTRMGCEIPYFKLGWSRDIIQHLKKLGVKRLFEKAALDNMAHLNNSVISNVIHAAEIQFVGRSRSWDDWYISLHRPPLVHFHANRPFLVLIYHQNSGNILLTGLIQNPADQNAPL